MSSSLYQTKSLGSFIFDYENSTTKPWLTNTAFNEFLIIPKKKLFSSSNFIMDLAKSIRSSHRRCSVKNGVVRNFSKFTGKHSCQSLFFNKVAGLRPSTWLKKSLWHRCFLWILRNFYKYFSYKTPPGDCFCSIIFLSFEVCGISDAYSSSKFIFKTFWFKCLVVLNHSVVTLQLYNVKNDEFKEEEIITF